MKQPSRSRSSYAADVFGRRWLCLYSDRRSGYDRCGREVIATVSAGVAIVAETSGRHGTAVSVSDTRLAAHLIIRITQIAVF